VERLPVITGDHRGGEPEPEGVFNRGGNGPGAFFAYRPHGGRRR
jgi:hypothetical protein